MNKNEIIDDLIIKWVNIADRDLMAAEQGLKIYPVLSEIVCFHACAYMYNLTVDALKRIGKTPAGSKVAILGCGRS